MNVYRVILKWKYHLLVLMILAAGLAALFSSKLFIKPLFKSYAIVYPANIFPYSDESETEQMLQLMNSGNIRDSIIKQFDLGNHYGLKGEDYYQSTLFYVYGERISVKKTEFESVIITVLDTDPKTACDIVNAIIETYNKNVSRLHKSKFVEVVQNFELVLQKKRTLLDSIQNSINELTSSGVKGETIEPNPTLISGFSQHVRKEDKKRIYEKDVVKKMRGRAGKNEGQLVLLNSLAMSEAEAYSEFKLKYDEAVLNLNRNYTYSNIVSHPFVSDKKVFPKPMLIVLISVLGTLFLSLLVISFIENNKHKQGDSSSHAA
jgi:Mg2+ and Co2+ transporter CorA